jgi:hypothetical protein
MASQTSPSIRTRRSAISCFDPLRTCVFIGYPCSLSWRYRQPTCPGCSLAIAEASRQPGGARSRGPHAYSFCRICRRLDERPDQEPFGPNDRMTTRRREEQPSRWTRMPLLVHPMVTILGGPGSNSSFHAAERGPAGGPSFRLHQSTGPTREGPSSVTIPPSEPSPAVPSGFPSLRSCAPWAGRSGCQILAACRRESQAPVLRQPNHLAGKRRGFEGRKFSRSFVGHEPNDLAGKQREFPGERRLATIPASGAPRANQPLAALRRAGIITTRITRAATRDQPF